MSTWGTTAHTGAAHTLHRAARWLLCALAAGLALGVAQTVLAIDAGKTNEHGHDVMGPPQRSVAEWLVRLQRASDEVSYVGTFVVSSAAGALSSSRIWHVCEGEVQVEKVEALTGTPRSTYRRKDLVATFWPQSGMVKTDQYESAGGHFPNLLGTGDADETARFYAVRETGRGRVAGFEADIVVLAPHDALRFGYRIWSEKRTGLVIKTQTLDAQGRVLEQAAFSELQLQAPMPARKLLGMMADTQGYRVLKSDRVRTTAQDEGWQLRETVAGFAPRNYYRRPVATGHVGQWIFSDGLATVSLFIEPFDARRHAPEGEAVLGATHLLSRRLSQGEQHWWVTAVGEVPAPTLRTFVDALQRSKPR